MRLYQIQRISDGKFFCGFKPYNSARYKRGEAMFEMRPGVMYRRIDNVRINLQWICSPVKYKGWNSRRSRGWKLFDPVYNPKKLNLYVVIVHDVDIQGVHKIKARKLFR